MEPSDPKTDLRPDPGKTPGRASGPVPEPISERGRAFLNELTAFVEFLRGLWGILAGISVFLPLSNLLFTVIPMAPQARDGAYHILPAGLVTALATLVTFFVLLSTFRRRGTLPEAGRKAWLSLIAGVLVLIAYLILHTVKMNIFGIWGVEGGHPVHLAFEIPMMVLYAGFFALIEKAFVLLGIQEICRKP